MEFQGKEIAGLLMTNLVLGYVLAFILRLMLRKLSVLSGFAPLIGLKA